MSTRLALGLVSVGLVLGVVASALGVMGRSRAVSAVLGMAGLVVGILALAWTIGGVACTQMQVRDHSDLHAIASLSQ